MLSIFLALIHPFLFSNKENHLKVKYLVLALAVSNNGKNIKIRHKLLRSSVFFSHEFQWWVGLSVLTNQCRLPQRFWLFNNQSHTSNRFKALPLKWLCCGHFTLGCCEKQVRLVHGIHLER